MKHVGNLQYITFLKGLAILGVILVHAPQLIKEINPLIREFLHAGAFGCQLFFVISGFLAVKSWERLLAKYENSTEKNRTTYKTFLKKRYLSIAPIYILFILFYQIISYYIATFNVEPFYKISHNPLSILANIFLLNGLDYQAFNNIVPGGWFIGTIFLFYLLFPLIYKLYRYIKTYNPRLLFLLPLGGVIVSAIFQTGIFFIIGDWTLSKPGSFTYYSIINQLPCMLIGVTLNYYLKNTKLSKNNLLLCFICLGLIGNLLWYALRLHYWIYALIPSIIGWSFFYLFLYVQRKSEEIRGGETVNNQTRNYNAILPKKLRKIVIYGLAQTVPKLHRHILQRLFPRNSIFDTIGAETQSIQRSRNIGRQKFFAAIVLRNRRPSHPPNLSILRKRHIQKREQCSVIPSRSLYVIIRPRQMRGEKDDRHQ